MTLVIKSQGFLRAVQKCVLRVGVDSNLFLVAVCKICCPGGWVGIQKKLLPTPFPEQILEQPHCCAYCTLGNNFCRINCTLFGGLLYALLEDGLLKDGCNYVTFFVEITPYNIIR